MTTGETIGQGANQEPRNLGELYDRLNAAVLASSLDPASVREFTEMYDSRYEWEQRSGKLRARIDDVGLRGAGSPFSDASPYNFVRSMNQFFGPLSPVASFKLEHTDLQHDWGDESKRELIERIRAGYLLQTTGTSVPNRFVPANPLAPFPKNQDIHFSDAPYKAITQVVACNRVSESGGEQNMAYSVGDRYVKVWWLGGTDFKTTRLIEEIEPGLAFSNPIGYGLEQASSTERTFALRALLAIANSGNPEFTGRKEYSLVGQTDKN